MFSVQENIDSGKFQLDLGVENKICLSKERKQELLSTGNCLLGILMFLQHNNFLGRNLKLSIS